MEIPDSVLYELLQWCVGNRGSKSCNPYTVPQIKEALRAVALHRGFKDVEKNYYDALDKWIE